MKITLKAITALSLLIAGISFVGTSANATRIRRPATGANATDAASTASVFVSGGGVNGDVAKAV
jgi:hypothetical protein